VVIEGLSWPLRPEEYYLDGGVHRPVMQGDIFEDVPFAKNKRASKFEDLPNTSYDRRAVAVLGYPCDIYNPDGRLARVQVVAPVIDAERAGIPPDWDGAFTVAPLPDLYGDARMFAVDLRVATNIDAFYLEPAKRVRCLSELGWAAFRQRLGLASTRLVNHLNDLMAVGADIWLEMELWQRWNEAGAQPNDFQAWLDRRDANLGGFTRRALLYRGMRSDVLAALEGELRASTAEPEKATRKAPSRSPGGSRRRDAGSAGESGGKS
jgi:hypothetical protein